MTYFRLQPRNKSTVVTRILERAKQVERRHRNPLTFIIYTLTTILLLSPTNSLAETDREELARKHLPKIIKRLSKVHSTNYKPRLKTTVFDKKKSNIPGANISLENDKVPVVYHGRANSGFPFKYYPKKTQTRKPTDDKGILLYVEQKLASLGFQLPSLPSCSGNHTRRKESHGNSFASLGINLLYYAANNPVEVEQARVSKHKTIAYKSGLVKRQNSNAEDVLLFMAPALGIKCLPTRVHIDSIGQKRFIEYKEGAHAWSK